MTFSASSPETDPPQSPKTSGDRPITLTQDLQRQAHHIPSIFILSRDVGKAATPGWSLGLSPSRDPFLGGVAMETDDVWLSFLGSPAPAQPI